MNALPPEVAATIAIRAYDFKDMTVADARRNAPLGCEGLFKVQDDSRFSGKSGGYVFRQLSGFGYIAEGEGTRQGEILIATRGTSTALHRIHVDLKLASISRS
jgi:hypothetical protein